MPPNEGVSRRSMIRAAVVITGLATGCEDAGGPAGSSSPTVTGATTPARDPAVVAAIRTVGTQLQLAGLRYQAAIRHHPALRARVTEAVEFRTGQLARLRALGAPTAPVTGKLPGVPTTAAAAAADLAARESALAVAHAATASTLSGEPARVLAMIAASETQLALTLGRKPGRR